MMTSMLNDCMPEFNNYALKNRGISVARFSLVAGLLIGTLMTTAAVAADLPVKARPLTGISAPEMNWTGFYAGVFGGYHDGKITQEGCTGLCPVNPKLTGGFVGLQAGYDHEYSNHIVAGVFGWVPLTRPKTSYDIGFGLVYDNKPRFAAVAAARFGYAFDKCLPYIFGGVGYANVEVQSGGLSWTKNYVGPVVGVGAEVALTRHISFDVRYMFSSAPKRTFDFGGGPESYGEYASNFIAGINYRF